MQRFFALGDWKATLLQWAKRLNDHDRIIRQVEGLDDWPSWEPVASATGTMTISRQEIIYAQYFEIQKTVWINARLAVTTAGVASTAIRITLPFPPAAAGQIQMGARCRDGGNVISGYAQHSAGDMLDVLKYDGTNWALAADRLVIVAGFYRKQ